MEKKFKPVGDGIIDNEGLVLEKNGNMSNLLAATINEITSNSKNLLQKTTGNNSEESETNGVLIEILFEKTAIVIKNESKISACAFSEV